MKEVTIDNVKARIALLEGTEHACGLTLKGEFELACLRQLAAGMHSEPVAEVRAYYPLGIDGGKQKFVQVTGELPDFGAQLYAAPPAQAVYSIGDATMRHIFTPTGMTNVSNMQAVFDQVETVLAGMEQPVPVVPDAGPSFDAMMRALDAFYADDDVPERAMLAAFKILLADVRSKPAPVVRDEMLLQNLETRINSLEIGEREGALSTQQATSLNAYRLAVQCLRSSATSDENATDNTAQQFEALATSKKGDEEFEAMLLAQMQADGCAPNTEPCVLCGVVSSHPEGWHYCKNAQPATSAGSGKQ